MSLGEKIEKIVAKNKNGLLGKHQSWERVRIDEIAEVFSGFPFKSSFFNQSAIGKPLVRIRDVKEGITKTYYSGQYDNEYLIHSGDFIVGMDGDFNCAEWKGDEALLNQRVSKLTVFDEYFNRKLFQYLLPGYLNAVNEETSSVTVKHLSIKTIQEIPLPLPPVNEQLLISGKLDELFSEVDAGTDALKRVEVNLKRYRASVLKAACEGKLVPTEAELAKAEGRDYEPASVLLERILKERKVKWEKEYPGKKYKEPEPLNTSELPELPDGWVWASFSQLTYKIGDVDHKMPKASSGGIPYISTKDFFNDEDIDFASAKKISKQDYLHLCKKISPDKNDILLSRYGTVGQVRIVKTNDPFQASYSIAIINTLSNIILVTYLKFCLRSEVLQKQIRRDTRSTAQPDLGLAHIREFAFPLPPEQEQIRILREMESVTSNIDKIVSGIEMVESSGPRLKQSILRKAFEGRLVPQDPEDESASVLLEKIKEEKTKRDLESKPKKQPVRKTKKKLS